MQCILSAFNQFLYENISPVNDWRSVQPHRICETAIFNCWRLEFRGRERVAFRKFHFPLTNRGTMCTRRGHRIARSWRSNLLVGAHSWAGPKRRATGGAEEEREPAKEREREGKSNEPGITHRTVQFRSCFALGVFGAHVSFALVRHRYDFGEG